MSDMLRVFLVAREDLLRDELRALADRCHPPVLLHTVVNCLEAQNAMATAAPDILLIAVAEEVLEAAAENNLDFATYIHDPEDRDVGDVGALLQWVRHRPRPMKVGLLYPGHRSMGPPLILRLMGCDYVFAENELREYFAQFLYEFWKAHAATDLLTNSIFLSYVRRNKSDVNPWYERLKKLQLAPWIDVHNLYPGNTWNPHIEKVIREADFFIPFLSRETTSRRRIFQWEIRIALEVAQKKSPSDCYLIPARLEEDSRMPNQLRRFHWVNLFEKDGLTRLLQTIVRGVYRRIPHGQQDAILIVEEDEILRGDYASVLHEAGYSPVTYDDPARAQDAFQGRHYPVVILDPMGGAGLPLLQAVRLRSQTTKVIITTRLGDPSMAHLLPYIFRCLPKSPQLFNEIRLHVHEALKALHPSS